MKILRLMAKRNAARSLREINHITVRSRKITRPLTLAVFSDMHDGPFDELLPTLAQCDAILIVGDLVERHGGGYMEGVRFLQTAPDVAPTFYAIGNHERRHPHRDAYWPHVEKSRVKVLDDVFTEFGGIVLGGLSSRREPKAAPAFLSDMARQDGFKLLMCHHPEYYPRIVKPCDIDLTLAGHAHGGQVRLGKQGLYAPGQGLLPRYTSGFYDDRRLLVSRGLTNATWAPRIRCACELIILHLEAENGQAT